MKCINLIAIIIIIKKEHLNSYDLQVHLHCIEMVFEDRYLLLYYIRLQLTIMFFFSPCHFVYLSCSLLFGNIEIVTFYCFLFLVNDLYFFMLDGDLFYLCLFSSYYFLCSMLQCFLIKQLSVQFYLFNFFCQFIICNF